MKQESKLETQRHHIDTQQVLTFAEREYSGSSGMESEGVVSVRPVPKKEKQNSASVNRKQQYKTSAPGNVTDEEEGGDKDTRRVQRLVHGQLQTENEEQAKRRKNKSDETVERLTESQTEFDRTGTELKDLR